MSASKKIRWAIVGLGSQGSRMAEAIEESKSSLLNAVCGTNPKHVKEFAERFKVPNKFNSFTSLIQNRTLFDALCITSETHKHVPQILLAAKAGIPILCEKPIAPIFETAKQIAHTVNQSHIPFRVGFQLRFHPLVLKAKQMIESGKIGNMLAIYASWSIGRMGQTKLPPLPSYMRWREDLQKSGGGAIAARGTHIFDLIEFLTQQHVVAIRGAQMEYYDNKTDTTTSIIATLQNGAAASIITSRVIPNPHNRIELCGSNGTIVLTEIFSPISSGTLDIETITQKKYSQKKKINLFKKEIEEFANIITKLNFRGIGATVEEGARNAAILEACFKANSSGTPIRVV